MSLSSAHFTIRAADNADVPAITSIYAEHVRTGTGTFDTVAPDEALMAAKVADCMVRGWPFLVAAQGDNVIGYAYAAQFRDRAAYAFACEDSIYIAADARGRGVGKALLERLIVDAEAAGFRQMLAVIGGSEPASVALHAALGFEPIGRMKSVGRKFGRWLDVDLMQLALGEGDDAPPVSEPG